MPGEGAPSAGSVGPPCPVDGRLLGALSARRVFVDDVHVITRVSTLLSAFGVLLGMALLALAVREYAAGASALWVGAGALFVLGEVCALVRDVRRLRVESAA